MKSKTIIAVTEALGLKYLEGIREAAGIFNGYYQCILRNPVGRSVLP